jgi:elongation factor G
METIATTDDTLLEAYLEGGEIDRDQAIAAMKAAMQRGEVFPSSAARRRRHGARGPWAGSWWSSCRTRRRRRRRLAQRPNIDQVVELRPPTTAPFAALVFKTMSEPHVGELSYFRIFSGTAATAWRC